MEDNANIPPLESGEQKPPDMRERILSAAARLFGSHGFEATSLQAIADAVGIRKASLLYHFPSKDALLDKVLDDSLDYWRRELPRVLTESATGYDRFDSAVNALLAFFRSEPDRARLTLREMLDRPESLRARFVEHLSPWIRMLTEYIRIGQASGTVKPEVDPESYVVQVMLMAISAAAIGDVAAAIAGTDAPADAGRQSAELVRIAREAVFVRPDAPKGKAG